MQEATTIFKVHADWDDEAEVWVATSDDVPGLVTEASSLDNLVKKLQVLIPELLDENGYVDDDHLDVPFEVLSRVASRTRRCHA